MAFADVDALRRELKEAEAELEFKDLEIQCCYPAGLDSCDDPPALLQEYKRLEAEITLLQEEHQTSSRLEGPVQDPGPSSSNMRQRVFGLEEELRHKCEVVRHLRQRELWFEMQLRRQQEAHGEPLSLLLEQVNVLRKSVFGYGRLVDPRGEAQIERFADQSCRLFASPSLPHSEPSNSGTKLAASSSESNVAPRAAADPLLQLTQQLRAQVSVRSLSIALIQEGALSKGWETARKIVMQLALRIHVPELEKEWLRTRCLCKNLLGAVFVGQSVLLAARQLEAVACSTVELGDSCWPTGEKRPSCSRSCLVYASRPLCCHLPVMTRQISRLRHIQVFEASQLGKTRSFRGASTAKWGSCGEFTCAETYVSWRPCQCNSLCKDYENCCSDYQAVCVSPPTPAIQDPVPSPPPASPTPALPDTSEQPVPVAVAPAETTPPAPANVYSVNVTALPWTWKDGSLNSPSASPLFTFYMYRAVSDEVYPPLNTNVASLPGVLWYLHHEVVIQAPRKFQISRILRYKVQMRATAPLLRLGMHFGVRLAYDKGQATGPFVCGRTNITNKDGTTEGYKPKFCGDGAAFKDQYLGDLKPYKNEYEYAAYGYNVGCNNLGQYPFPMHQVYYPNAICCFQTGKDCPVGYTMPGACPNNLYFNKDNSCQASQPGGYCPGVEPNGNGTCTWNYEEAGEISLDELVGIKDYASWRHSHREYDPETDEGIKFRVKARAVLHVHFGLVRTFLVQNAKHERVRQAAELFDRRYPSMPTVAELRNPPCDFDFGSFYKEWYRKDGYVGPCGPPNANCKGGIGFIRHEGLSLHPKWYVPLTDSASDDEIQRLLYQLGCAEDRFWAGLCQFRRGLGNDEKQSQGSKHYQCLTCARQRKTENRMGSFIQQETLCLRLVCACSPQKERVPASVREGKERVPASVREG
eukprot:s167_g27.t2